MLEWKPPHAKWFLGGKLNASVNCLDRHVRAGRGGRVALICEGAPRLKGLWVRNGDRVAIYVPTTLADPAVVAKLRDQYESHET